MDSLDSNDSITKTKRWPGIVLGVLILALLVANIFLVLRYNRMSQELAQIKETEAIQEKTLAFAELFIESILKADAEVSLDTQVNLEMAARELGDQAILEQWQRFVKSENEAEAQEAVRDLLASLVSKAQRP